MEDFVQAGELLASVSAVLSTLLLITAAVMFSALGAGAALADAGDPRAIDGYLSLLRYALVSLRARFRSL